MLNACADWLVKLQISCAIYLRATREKMASRFVSVTSEEIIQNIFLWCILSRRFSIYLNNYSLQCWWLALDIKLAALRLGKYPYLLHGRDFFDKNPMENQLDFIHFIHFLEMHPPLPPGISNPSAWGIWIFSLSVIEQ